MQHASILDKTLRELLEELEKGDEDILTITTDRWAVMIVVGLAQGGPGVTARLKKMSQALAETITSYLNIG